MNNNVSTDENSHSCDNHSCLSKTNTVTSDELIAISDLNDVDIPVVPNDLKPNAIMSCTDLNDDTEKMKNDNLFNLSNKSELLRLSEVLKSIGNEAYKDSFANIGKALGESLSALSGQYKLLDLSATIIPKLYSDQVDSLVNAGKILGLGLSNTTKLRESFGTATALKSELNPDLFKSIFNSSKLFDDNISSFLDTIDFSSIFTKFSSDWHTNLSDSLGYVSRVYDSHLADNIADIAKSLTKLKSSQVTIDDMSDFITKLNDLNQKTTDDTTVEDFICDLDVPKADIVAKSEVEKMNNRKYIVIILISIYLYVMSMFSQHPIDAPSNQTLNEVQTSLINSLNVIKDYWMLIKENLIDVYKNIDSKPSVGSFLSVILSSVSGSLVYDFLKLFIVLLMKKISVNHLEIKSIHKVNNLINDAILELSDDRSDITLMRELLSCNLAIVKRNNTKVRSSMNNKNCSFLYKNQIVIKDKKVKKWVSIQYLVDNNLNKGWVLSKSLMKLNLT